jgi:hypothetical protein
VDLLEHLHLAQDAGLHALVVLLGAGQVFVGKLERHGDLLEARLALGGGLQDGDQLVIEFFQVLVLLSEEAREGLILLADQLLEVAVPHGGLHLIILGARKAARHLLLDLVQQVKQVLLGLREI